MLKRGRAQFANAINVMRVAQRAGRRSGLLTFLGFSARPLTVEVRTTHGNDCEKLAPSACAQLSHMHGPENAAKNATHSGSGPSQGPSEVHTHDEAQIQSPHKVREHTCTSSCQRSDTALAPAAKNIERYEQVDSLIELLGDRYEHVDALIELLDKCEMNSAPESIDSPSNGHLMDECQEPVTDCCDDTAFVCSTDGLDMARKMYAGAWLGATRKHEDHAYAWQEASNSSSELITALTSALEPKDYSRQILRNALLQAGIVESGTGC